MPAMGGKAFERDQDAYDIIRHDLLHLQVIVRVNLSVKECFPVSGVDTE